ncbi:hypothetical protein bas01_0064 [Escherichia phage AugustePiccard]|uniref:Uncharacterized protein n=1 Tax=Escherichia phage AugustePiccard TaxID=2851954 RepID=A0AAE8AWN5_9CAUD|nr:hypothetical protein bas01_0064 [Escherichia phage AugustePiccard]
MKQRPELKAQQKIEEISKSQGRYKKLRQQGTIEFKQVLHGKTRKCNRDAIRYDSLKGNDL